MALHNASLIRHIYVWVRVAYLYDQERTERNPFVRGVWHGVSSTPSRMLDVQVVLENGARWQLPLQAICAKPAPVPKSVQAWDCFGWNLTITEYDYLRELDVEVQGLGHGRYLFSLDWFDNGFSDEPEQHKEMTMVALASGNFALQPNNRLRFIDKSFTETSEKLPEYRVLTRRFYAE